VNTRIRITDQDERRLSLLLRARQPDDSLLEERLDAAEIVSPREIPPDVVTMNSTVLFEDLDSGRHRQVTLLYPGSPALAAGGVSILAPVGSALIGVSEGEAVEWRAPGNPERRLRVVAVKYQPEASGHFDL
jgi:regulator of nucleoside diphosphate kinase